MDLNDLVLVSVDDHVIEPADMFRGRLPKKFEDRAPHVTVSDDGAEGWEFVGQRIVTFGLNAVAGTPPTEYGIDPTNYDQMRPGCYDIHARIKDMDANGVLGSICFPTFPRFCGQVFQQAALTEPELALATVKAYNDWHIDEWAGTYPGRIIPLSVPVLWQADLAAEEIWRVAAKGCHAVTFSENPEKIGLPSLYSDSWDPFWAACEETGTVVCLHIGSSSSMPITTRDAPVDVSIAITPLNAMMTLTDLLFNPALTKFPGLKIAMSEGGIGWVPYVVERCDYVYAHHHAWTGTTLDSRPPSDRFRQHVTTCFIDDRAGIFSSELIGADRITWECDYPHSDSTWPTSPETLWPSVASLPDPVINKITHENAMRLYLYDPFVHIPRDQCTVGALRQQSTGWDVAIHSFNRSSTSVNASVLAELTNVVR